DLLSYAITSGNALGGFVLSSTGALTVNDVSMLDFETNPTFNLEVEVSDGALSATATITINLEDVNEVPTLAAVQLSIPENSTQGTLAVTLVGSDVDGDVLSYAITSGNDLGGFALSSTGALTVNDVSVLDFEINPTFSLEVEVSDGAWSATATVTINLKDVNEAPSDLIIVNNTINENEQPNTFIGELITTGQDASNTYTYSLVNGNGDIDNTSFIIQGNSLFSATSFDFETQSSLNIRIAANDENEGSFEKEFVINVLDVNERPSDISLDNSQIRENQPAGTFIAKITTTDEDNGDTHTYSFSSINENSDNSNFNISNDSLYTAIVLDYEVQSTYSISIRAADNGNLDYTEVFDIKVLDASEFPSLSRLSKQTEIPYNKEYIETFNVQGYPTPELFVLESPIGLSLSQTILSWTPTSDQIGTHTISIKAENAEGADTLTFEIMVLADPSQISYLSNNRQSNVARNATLKVLFDPMRIDTTGLKNQVGIYGEAGYLPFDYDYSGDTLRLTSASAIRFGEEVVVSLDTTINNLSAAYVGRFFTETKSSVLDLSFQQTQDDAVKTTTYHSILADISGDGLEEVVSISFNNSELRVIDREGNADIKLLGSGKFPYDLLARDFDKDGDLDVAVTYTGTAQVAIFWNNAGTLSSPSLYTVGASPRGITATDLNEDGLQDIITANSVNNFSVLYNSGSQVFATANIGLGNSPYGVAYGDVNEDGRMDLISANRDHNNISLAIQQADGSFTVSSMPVGSSPYDLSVIDINQDQHEDILVANSVDNTVSVLVGDGTGAFTTLSPISTSANPRDLVSNDFNGDGNIDFAVVAADDNTLQVFAGNGDGTFAAPIGRTTGSYPTGLFARDVGNDGSVDLLVSNGNDTKVQLFRNLPQPFIISQYPAANQREVRTDSVIRLDFNLPLDIATIDATTFLVTGNTSGTVAGQLTFANDDKTIIFTPDAAWPYDEVVTVTLTTEILTKDNVALELVVFSFTVKPNYIATLGYLGEGAFTTTAVSPTRGTILDLFEFRVLYTNLDGELPAPGYPQLELDLNGDGDILDEGEGAFPMVSVDADGNVRDGKIYAYRTPLPQGTDIQHRFTAIDENGGEAVTESELLSFVSSPDVLGGKPDIILKAESMLFSNENPQPNEDFTVTIDVENDGEAIITSAFDVVLFVDETAMDTVTISGMSFNSSTTVTFDLSIDSAAFYAVRIVADLGESVDEVSELNNVVLRPLLIGEAAIAGNIEVTLNNTGVYRAWYNENISGTAKYTGVFGGEQPVAGAQVLLFLNGDTIRTTTNSDGTFVVRTRMPAPGDYVLNAKVTDFRLRGEAETTLTVENYVEAEKEDLGDLIITAKYEGTSSPYAGDLVSASYTVHNIGDKAVSNVLVYLMSDNQRIDSVRISEIPADSSSDFKVVTTSFSGVGSHWLSFRLDPTNEIPENDEYESNIASLRYIVKPSKPNLFQSDESVSSDPVVGIEEHFNFYVTNSGLRESGAFNVQVLIDGQEVYVAQIANLLSDERARFKVDHTFTTAGRKVLSWKVDAGEEVDEFEEGDNTGQRIINVRNRMPDLVALSAFLLNTPLNPAVGENVDFTAVFTNNGEVASAASEAKFSINGSDYENIIEVPAIEVGKEATVRSNIPFIPGDDTTYVSKVHINFARALEELRYDNNVATRAVVVGFSSDLEVLPGDIMMSDEYAEDGDNVGISVKTRNNGTLLAVAKIELYFKNDRGQETFITALPMTVPAGGSDTTEVINFQLPFVRIPIIARISGVTPVDYDLSNNRAEKTFGDLPPVIHFPSVTNILEDESIAFNLDTLVTDIGDGVANLSWTFQAVDSAMVTLDAETHLLNIVPFKDFNGKIDLILTVVDDDSESDTDTLHIQVTPVNDVPYPIRTAGELSYNEDAGDITTNQIFTANAGAYNESFQQLEWVVSNDNNPLFSEQPSINSDGMVTFQTAANMHGTATVSYQIKDNGGTANGGIDASETFTFLIVIHPVNDAPSFTKGANQEVFEDAAPQLIEAWAKDIFAGAANETEQKLTFQLSTDNDALFEVLPAINLLSGDLTYTLAKDANGLANVSVVLMDDGGKSRNGSDASQEQTFTINVISVNDAPSFTNGENVEVLEDAGVVAIQNWASNIDKGALNESDEILAFELLVENNAIFEVLPSIDPRTGNLTFTTAKDESGETTVFITLLDNGGTENGGNDKKTDTFTISVLSVNDAPTFTKGADQEVLEDAQAQIISGWATEISAGADNESSQELTFALTTNNDALFSELPSIDATSGDLTYSLLPDANGKATVTILLSDNGGVANTGIDITESQTFDITVLSVNDVPAFVKGEDQEVLEDAQAQVITGWATGISAGADNESSQELTFTLTSNNDALFTELPSIDATSGDLSYTLLPNANGKATVVVLLSDNGGVANTGIDITESQTFDITVLSVNDAPTVNNAIPNKVINEDELFEFMIPANTFIDVDLNDRLSITASIIDGSPFPAWLNFDNATNTFSGTPTNDDLGTIAISVSAIDQNAESTSTDFTLEVINVNDAPTVANAIPDQTTNEDEAFSFQIGNDVFADEDAG
ncbi:MAG: CARDB domain-containing protein, partial [Cyclobacteriaceae bacterium]